MGLGHKINQFSLGASINRLQYHIENWGTKSFWIFEIGGIAHISESFNLGMNFYNLGVAKFSEEERLPVLMRIGFSYKPTENLTILGESEKNLEEQPIFKGGIEYQVIKQVLIRTGISSQPFSSHFGFGLRLRKFLIDYALNSHPQLGFSSQFGIIYRFKKNS